MGSSEIKGSKRGDFNPDHHLWNNNGTWFMHYTVYPTSITKERVRWSLKTRCVHTARLRRDALIVQITEQGLLHHRELCSNATSPAGPGDYECGAIVP